MAGGTDGDRARDRPDAALRWSAALLAVSVGLAHLMYPVWFYDYLEVKGWAVGALVRNLALLGAGLLAVRTAWRYQPAPDLAPEPVPSALSTS